MEDTKIINENLLKFFGNEPESNSPLFRLVWSEGLMEVRKGTFVCEVDGMKVGEYEGTEKVKKYSYLKEKWILEMYDPAQSSSHDDIVKSDGYEPVFVFQDKNQNYLKPLWKVVLILCRAILEQKGKKSNRTEAMDRAEYEELGDREAEQFMEMLNIDPMHSAFRDGDAILLPGKDF